MFALVWAILADFWVPHKIKSSNFQNLLVFGFSETFQNLICTLRQLFFHYFKEGPFEKIPKPQKSAKLPQTRAKRIWSFHSQFKQKFLNCIYAYAFQISEARTWRTVQTDCLWSFCGHRHSIYIRTVSSYFCWTGLNWFMGCLGTATFTVYLISAQTSQEVFKCAKDKEYFRS